jgi:hypothetical protein
MNEYGELMEKSKEKNPWKCKRRKKNIGIVGSTEGKEPVGRFRHENVGGKH